MQFLTLQVAAIYWLSWTTLSFAQTISSPTLLPALVPSCAHTCLTQEMPFSGCALTDIACQCGSRNLTVETAKCMLANCTMDDTLALSKFQATLCKAPVEDKSHTIISVFIAIASVVSALCALRFLAVSLRSEDGKKLEMKVGDWIFVAAMVIAIVPTVLTFIMASEGFGKHLYSLSNGDLLLLLRYFYIANIFLIASLALIKISILTSFLHLIPLYPSQPSTGSKSHPYAHTHSPKLSPSSSHHASHTHPSPYSYPHTSHLRTTLILALSFTILSSTILILLSIFSCQPVSYFWNRDQKQGVCLDVDSLARTSAAMSVVQDVLVLGVGGSLAWGLWKGGMMRRPGVVGVVCLFAFGAFAIVSSLLRLKHLLAFSNSIDPTWDYVPVVLWTGIELGVLITTFCLPAAYSLLTRTLSTFMTTRGKTVHLNENEHGENNGKMQARDEVVKLGRRLTGLGWGEIQKGKGFDELGSSSGDNITASDSMQLKVARETEQEAVSYGSRYLYRHPRDIPFFPAKGEVVLDIREMETEMVYCTCGGEH